MLRLTPVNLRVVCFYVNLDSRTRESIEVQTPDAEFVDTSGDEFAYWRALNDRWTGESDLIVIEQDIGLKGTEIMSFASCSYPWCTFSYKVGQEFFDWCLGCTKFSAEVQANPIGKMKWTNLDVHIVRSIRLLNKQHVHGTVDHFHNYGEQGSDNPNASIVPETICWKCNISMITFAGRKRCERCGITA